MSIISVLNMSSYGWDMREANKDLFRVITFTNVKHIQITLEAHDHWSFDSYNGTSYIAYTNYRLVVLDTSWRVIKSSKFYGGLTLAENKYKERVIKYTEILFKGVVTND